MKLESLAVHYVHHKESNAKLPLLELWISKAHLGLLISFASELEYWRRCFTHGCPY